MQQADPSSQTSRRVAELIELGRDREAAELALLEGGSTDGSRGFKQGVPMDVLDQLDQLGPLLATVVAGIRVDQLDNSTPCANFTVRGVLEHMIGGATTFTTAFGGTPPADANTDNVLQAFGSALGGLADAMHQPGALHGTVDAPFGTVSGATFGRFVVLDGLVHGWDLATATGQPYEPPDNLVTAAFDFARETIDPLRDGDTFAAAVESAAGASPIEQLANYTGR